MRSRERPARNRAAATATGTTTAATTRQRGPFDIAPLRSGRRGRKKRYGFGFAEEVGTAQGSLDHRAREAVEAALPKHRTQNRRIVRILEIRDRRREVLEAGTLPGKQRSDVVEHAIDLGFELPHVDGTSCFVDARGSGDVEGHLVRLSDPQAAREVRTISPRFVEQRGVHGCDVERPGRRRRIEPHGKVVRLGKGNALNAGAGGPSLDAAVREELASSFVERAIVRSMSRTWIHVRTTLAKLIPASASRPSATRNMSYASSKASLPDP